MKKKQLTVKINSKKFNVPKFHKVYCVVSIVHSFMCLLKWHVDPEIFNPRLKEWFQNFYIVQRRNFDRKEGTLNKYFLKYNHKGSEILAF